MASKPDPLCFRCGLAVVESHGNPADGHWAPGGITWWKLLWLTAGNRLDRCCQSHELPLLGNRTRSLMKKLRHMRMAHNLGPLRSHRSLAAPSLPFPGVVLIRTHMWTLPRLVLAQFSRKQKRNAERRDCVGHIWMTPTKRTTL